MSSSTVTFGTCPLECEVRVEGRDATSALSLAMLWLVCIFLVVDFLVGVVAVSSSTSNSKTERRAQ
jgi:hypothetical protein